MATIGRTLLRLTGATLLGASAASIDNPSILFAPSVPIAKPVVDSARPEVAPPDIKITPGKRAMAFRVNDTGIVPLIQPDNRVDILLGPNGPEQQAAKLLMEDMRVLAIGLVPSRAEDGRPVNIAVATVEVTPDEGERLASAADE